MNIPQVIEGLIGHQMHVDDLKDKDINTLKAIGWQFALRWRHTTDKHSKAADELGTILTQIKTLVRSKKQNH